MHTQQVVEEVERFRVSLSAPVIAHPALKDLSVRRECGFIEGEAEFLLKKFDIAGETQVPGRIMAEQNAAMDGEEAGLLYALALMKCQWHIPVAIRGRRYLIFTGTDLVDGAGHLCVPFLFWYVSDWRLRVSRLTRDWHSNGRIVRICSPVGSASVVAMMEKAILVGG